MDNTIFINNIFTRFTLIFFHSFSVLIAIIIMGLRLEENLFGLISIYLILFQISFILTEWGYQIYSLHSYNEKGKNYLKKIFPDIIFSKLIFVLFNTCICIIFFHFNSHLIINTKSVFFLILSMTCAAFNPLWFLQSISYVNVILVPTIIGRIFFLIIVFFFVKEDSLELFFLGQFIAFLLPSLFGNLFIIKKFKPKIFFNFDNIIKIKIKTFSIFVSTLIQNYIFIIWGFFLILFSNPVQIAYFVLAEQILRAANGIGNVFQEVYMSIKKKVKKHTLYKNLIILIFITILASVISFLFIDTIFQQLFKDKLLGTIPVIKIIIICWFFITIIKITNYPFTENFKEIKKINDLALIVFVINIIFIILNYSIFEIDALNTSVFFLLSVIIHFFLNSCLMRKKIIFFLQIL